ncbi:MAG: gamma carbonic anhydrase family protein [Gammaproteobacteria bacterium]|nr:gamma carbonic anhydrase family protein [Gammaproteobacteria bacterium]
MPVDSFENIKPDIHPTAYIHEQALVVGDVVIGEDSSVWPFTVIRGDVNAIRIGHRTNVQDNSVLHVTHDGPYRPGGYSLEIGNEVTVGHRVILHGCKVGNQCLIGMGAIVMDGAVLQDRVLLGAGSLVTPGKELTGGYLWMGQPAKKIRELSEQELESLEYSAQHYVRVKNRYLQT